MIQIINNTLSWLIRSWWIRILVILVVGSLCGYRFYVLPKINQEISDNYFKYTGHHLSHDKINIQLSDCKFYVGHLKDDHDLWSANSVGFDVACWQSIKTRMLVVNSIKIQSLHLNVLQDEKGGWNFGDVLQHLKQMPKPKEPTEKEAGPKSDSNPVIIDSLSFADASINTNVQALNNLQLSITPVHFIVRNIDLKHKSSVRFVLESTINEQTQFNSFGELSLKDFSGVSEMEIRGVPFKWANSFVKSMSELEILDGRISSKLKVTIKNGLPDTVQSSGSFNNFKVRPTSMDQDAVKWQSLSWTDAKIDIPNKSVTVPQMLLDEFDTQFILNKDRTTNYQAMLKKPTEQELAAQKAADASAVEAKAAKKKHQKKSLANTQPVVAPEVKAALPTNAANTNANNKTDWKVFIQTLSIQNAAVGFNDQSLNPSFTAIVQHFSGEVNQISNLPNQEATFKLAGDVDGYAPVSLEGKANLLIEQPKLEAVLSFQRMDMGAFSPYSAEYAGWKIRKGLLSVDLNYHYENGKILGKNHVVIDHLVFGEKVRSPHVMDIPLRFGLYLLTDEKGLAILDTEVSGDPKDPKFKLSAVIWRAFTNSLKKIVSAPFRLLSRLVDTKEDLGKIGFTPGESQLTDAAVEKLKLLQQALTKRKQLKLSVKGVYDIEKDDLALREEQIKSRLQALGVSQADITARNQLWLDKVGEVYATLNLPAASLTGEEKYQDLIQREQVAPDRLHKLAHERAQAVKQYFVLQQGLDNNLFLLDSDDTCKDGKPCHASEVMFTLEE